MDERHLTGQLGQDRIVGSVRPLEGAEEGLAAFFFVTDALEGSGLVAQADEHSQLAGERRLGEGLGAIEDVGEHLGGHEGSEDQIDEQTLVADPAPGVETTVGILMEGAVAGSEEEEKLIEVGEHGGNGELRAIAQPREIRDVSDACANKRAQSSLKLETL